MTLLEKTTLPTFRIAKCTELSCTTQGRKLCRVSEDHSHSSYATSRKQSSARSKGVLSSTRIPVIELTDRGTARSVSRAAGMRRAGRDKRLSGVMSSPSCLFRLRHEGCLNPARIAAPPKPKRGHKPVPLYIATTPSCSLARGSRARLLLCTVLPTRVQAKGFGQVQVLRMSGTMTASSRHRPDTHSGPLFKSVKLDSTNRRTAQKLCLGRIWTQS